MVYNFLGKKFTIEKLKQVLIYLEDKNINKAKRALKSVLKRLEREHPYVKKQKTKGTTNSELQKSNIKIVTRDGDDYF